jgi:type II secretory pathway predicted ATPase ExeA
VKSNATLSTYGLKWNPFLADVPLDGLVATPRVSSFCYRIESLVIDGGFAMITGEPGTGKSVLLRLLEDRLSQVRDLTVCAITRPQSSIADFYREIGSHFDTSISMSNRWSGYKALRDRWLSHIDVTSLHPVILIDEAQEMRTETMAEIKHLASAAFDAKTILTVVLCGDLRLTERFREKELYPLGTRVRTRYTTEPATKEELIEILEERIERAGNKALMTHELIATLADHSAGNFRVMLNTADELFARAAEKKSPHLDEKLFLELFGRQDHKKPRKERTR